MQDVKREENEGRAPEMIRDFLMERERESNSGCRPKIEINKINFFGFA